MKRWFVLVMLFAVFTAFGLSATNPVRGAVRNLPGSIADNPVSGMPGWPVPDEPIPHHEPGRPARLGDDTTYQISRLNVDGQSEMVELTGPDALLANGTMSDPLQGNYQLIGLDKIAFSIYDAGAPGIALQTYQDTTVDSVVGSQTTLATSINVQRHARDITAGLEYIRNHTEITNVLLSGGDPLILSTDRLEKIIQQVREIDHVNIIRIGSKIPSFNPFRILNDPSLLKMMGHKRLFRPVIKAVLEESLKKKPGRKHFLRGITRVKNGKYYVSTTGAQGSGILKSMVMANGLIILPEDKNIFNPGEEVKVQVLDRSFEVGEAFPL